MIIFYLLAKMQKLDEKYCLVWNEFQANLCSSFGDLREDKDFTDVTLACDDGQQLEAHKVVLISSSPFFMNLLRKNKHPHPLVYMRGLKYENILSLVDFLYHGEANVFQENLESFLAMTDDLQLKGFKRDEEVESSPKEASKGETSKPSKSTKTPTDSSKDMPPPLSPPAVLKTIKDENMTDSAPKRETETHLDDFSTSVSDIEELSQKVKSMMTFSENPIAGTHTKRKGRICNVCGKEGQRINIMDHIEVKHIKNISIPCNICDKTLNSRRALDNHKRKYHSRSEFLAIK